MNVLDLKLHKKIELHKTLITKLGELSPHEYPVEEVIDASLSSLINTLDDLAQDDAFGTQGWKYFFGLK